jgi:hypothetical protein
MTILNVRFRENALGWFVLQVQVKYYPAPSAVSYAWQRWCADGRLPTRWRDAVRSDIKAIGGARWRLRYVGPWCVVQIKQGHRWRFATHKHFTKTPKLMDYAA